MENLYPAVANRPSPQLELKLLGLLGAAADRQYPIKLALVANENDLAHRPIMLRRPQLYADTLVRELGGPGAFRAPVLVVTPYGFGVAGPGARGVRPLLDRLPPPGPAGDALARAGMVAVRQTARAGGHVLPANVAPLSAVQPSAATAAPTTAGNGPDVRLLAGLAAGAFLLAVLAFEIRLRLVARRGAHVEEA
jgi:hypothetical protein